MIFGLLLPGMGAVYNRQNIKAIVHFVSVIGLYQLAQIRVLGGFFALGGLALHIYTVVDAYRTARSIAGGESAATDEERFKRSLARRAPMVGTALIVAGLLIVLQLLQPFGRISATSLAAVALIVLGGYLLTRYVKRSREQEYPKEESRRLPYALIPGGFSQQPKRSSSHPGEQRWR
jgi:hypothetical protein